MTLSEDDAGLVCEIVFWEELEAILIIVALATWSGCTWEEGELGAILRLDIGPLATRSG